MAAAKKTSFWHVRKNIAPNNEKSAELLGVDVAEILRMDKEGAPAVMEQFLLMWDHKHINAPGWDGWCFSRGALMHKRMIWKPENLLNARREAERIGQLEAEIHKL